MIDIEKDLFNRVSKDIKEKVSHMRCPVHGEYSRVTILGNSLKNLRWEVSACCEEAREHAVKQLGLEKR